MLNHKLSQQKCSSTSLSFWDNLIHCEKHESLSLLCLLDILGLVSLLGLLSLLSLLSLVSLVSLLGLLSLLSLLCLLSLLSLVSLLGLLGLLGLLSLLSLLCLLDILSLVSLLGLLGLLGLLSLLGLLHILPEPLALPARHLVLEERCQPLHLAVVLLAPCLQSLVNFLLDTPGLHSGQAHNVALFTLSLAHQFLVLLDCLGRLECLLCIAIEEFLVVVIIHPVFPGLPFQHVCFSRNSSNSFPAPQEIFHLLGIFVTSFRECFVCFFHSPSESSGSPLGLEIITLFDSQCFPETIPC